MKILYSIILTIPLLCISCNDTEINNETENTEDLNVEWYEPEDPTPKEQCPCCDYITLPERGNYLICPICFWEDDGLDIDDLDSPSAPNHGITLRNARLNFEKFGACEKEMVKSVIPDLERGGFERKVRIIPEN